MGAKMAQEAEIELAKWRTALPNEAWREGRTIIESCDARRFATLIARLARDGPVRGQGVGELLFAGAIRRILGAGRSIAVFAIVVDAKNDHAVAFYKRYGFRPFPSRPRRLFHPTMTAAAGLEAL